MGTFTKQFKLPKRLYRVGKLYFKLILNSDLKNDKRTDQSIKIATILEDMGVIKIVGEGVDKFFYYEAGQEWPDHKLVSEIKKYLADKKY